MFTILTHHFILLSRIPRNQENLALLCNYKLFSNLFTLFQSKLFKFTLIAFPRQNDVDTQEEKEHS